MGRLTAFKTREVFDSMLEQNLIPSTAMVFIIDTGQIYTHGIFINGATYGTEVSGAVNLTVGGTTKSISLSTHTHSNYYSNTSNLNIGSYKIVSGTKDLLRYDSLVRVGDTSVPLVLQGSTDITVTKGNNSCTLLDTDNFSIEEKTITGVSSLNALTFKYGSNKLSINYVRNISTSSTFDSLTGNNNLGINTLNSKTYGIITMSDMGLPLEYAQIRANITDHVLEFRDSGSTSWKTIVTTNTTNALGVAGVVSGTSASDANKVWGTDSSGNPGWQNNSSINSWRPILIEGTQKLSGDSTSGGFNITGGTGISLSWDDTNKKLVITSTAISANTTAIISGNVAGSEVSTIISADSSSGLIFEGGNGSFKIGNGENYMTVNVAPPSKDLTFNGNTYAIYSSANALPTIYAADSASTTANQVWAVNSLGDGYEWRSISATAFTTDSLVLASDYSLQTFTKTLIVTNSWISTGITNNDITTSGTYIVQLKNGNHHYSGVMSWFAGIGGVNDEIALHYSGPGNPTRIYLQTYNGQLQIAADEATSSATYVFNFRKIL